MATQAIHSLTDTWNAGATVFTGIGLNVTDTASAAGSLLLDLQVGGVSKFSVTKAASASFLSASLRLGAADAAAPVAQTLGVQSVVAGTSNTAGADFTIAGSRGTGTGTGGSLVFQVAPAGGSGTAQNALATRLQLIAANAGIEVTNHVYSPSGQALYLGAGGFVFGGQMMLNGSSKKLQIPSDFTFSWSSDTSSFATSDVVLARDAAGTLAQRNGVNAQSFRVYNTYTDASNYERGVFDWATTANSLTIGTQQVGTGSARSLALVTQGDANLLFRTNSVTRFDVSSLGLRATANLLWTADNTYDIGASGANRPRSIYTSQGVVFANSLAVNSSTFHSVLWNAGQYGWASAGTASTTSAIDTGFARSAAAIVRVTDGSTGGGAMQLTEMTAPAAPAADNVRIYAVDNGSGKTQLMALFATGAAVQIAIEP